MSELLDIDRSLVIYQIHQNIDLYDYCQYQGIYSGPRKQVFILCPFHFEEKPSARLYPDGLCWCFGCGKMYNVLDFCMQVQELSYGAAVAWLQKTFDFRIKKNVVMEKKLREEFENKWLNKIIGYKYKLPLSKYKLLWQAYDQRSLTDQEFYKLVKSG